MNQNVIKLLPKNVISQIAAGETIERPSSILRELMENSIDANAKKIDIFIKDSGKTLIQLVDDGDGMSLSDARMSIQRFATSKIYNVNDLFKIHTKGFRGEGLSSIALIAELEIQTKNNKSSEGVHLFIEEGKIKKELPINMHRGTRISVKNIFSRFPVRRKFLKSSKIEFIHIVNEFYKIVISHREILYRFFHNEKILFYLKKTSLKERIKEIFKNKNRILTSFLIKKEKFLIQGFVSIPNSSTTKKGDRFLVVNKRCVKHLLLHKKIVHAYNGFLKNFNTISYFIFIDIVPNLVNWNIHPAKKEVKLDGEEEISTLIKQELKNVLFHQYKVENIKNKELKDSNILSSCDSDKKNFFLNYYNSCSNSEIFSEKVFKLRHLNKIKNEKHNSLISNENKLHDYVFKKIKIKTIQINRKYIVFTLKNEDMILVDQHRAHSNILYEFFHSKKNLIIQKLFFPLKIKLSKKEFFYLKNIKEDLKYFGFYFYFRNKFAYLYTIPDNINQNTLRKIFKDVLNYDLIKEKSNKKDMIIKSISKSAAIKYGEKLNSDQMEYLIRDLFSCKNYNYTYTGDPVFFRVNENFFKSEYLYKF
ncbi:DNA mismatch repair endonuclease MutL [Blattabacterium cuenoti]|uniref:DNA mismatch repair endonuclease MutL n=1 Tax=Blattabacterium cuenoti TaxID=1653831 RepID=UPI00163D278B|nr:DNA mismatch repair endonuclease MutL [Blattabacterium cuenoti]